MVRFDPQFLNSFASLRLSGKKIAALCRKIFNGHY